MNTIQIERDKIPYRKQSNTPYLTHCRRLLKKGVDPETRLEITRNGRVDFIISSIGYGAKWTVDENRFVPYVNNFEEQPNKTPTPTP